MSSKKLSLCEYFWEDHKPEKGMIVEFTPNIQFERGTIVEVSGESYLIQPEDRSRKSLWLKLETRFSNIRREVS